MSNPAYLWLTDENGSPVTGSCLMPTRLGSIELRSVSHHVWLPTDQHTGRLTGTRLHAPVLFQKEFDKTTPLLFRALCEGRTLKSATIKMYKINDAGIEVGYFNMLLENVKITAITPNLHPSGMTNMHLEEINLRYETITWKHTDGNIMYKDCWNDRIVA
ncbi:type VI secretion system tube protein Hcp [Citrobacter sedlakii]|uniref:Type VI secretion system tube protein Hcp n=1 Tax=Citrobacter sedlakii TaxID=67826 RepID=A0ABS0ZSY6_9ENTR|nr:type VI secretion system tube protein TssD [Citrobacter sedlakii]MBJ8381938.1 type VI secretion system tube protein Hcp [Citrobacter sedlakii]